MPYSTLTRKGQTTIPKEIRDFLSLKPNDKIFYQIEGDKVSIKPIRGNLLELRGSVPARRKPEDFEKVRKEAREKMAKRVAESQ